MGCQGLPQVSNGPVLCLREASMAFPTRFVDTAKHATPSLIHEIEMGPPLDIFPFRRSSVQGCDLDGASDQDIRPVYIFRDREPLLI